jgi:hypothetical protein
VLALGLVCRTGYKISDSLARSAGTVYKRAYRQAFYAGLVVTGALVGRRWGITGVAWGVLLAIVANYVAMAALSLTTTGLSWSRFLAAHLRGLVLAAGTALATYACTAVLRSAGAGALVVLVGAGGVVTVALLGAARMAPDLVLGADAMWVVKRVKDKRR